MSNSHTHHALPVVLLLSCIALSGMTQCRQEHEIQFKAYKGIHRIELSAAIPDTGGIIRRLPLQLPEYDEGYFFTGDTLEWLTHSNREK